eukprot:7383978-Prymnesium_polylepis.1
MMTKLKSHRDDDEELAVSFKNIPTLEILKSTDRLHRETMIVDEQARTNFMHEVTYGAAATAGGTDAKSRRRSTQMMVRRRSSVKDGTMMP